MQHGRMFRSTPPHGGRPGAGGQHRNKHQFRSTPPHGGRPPLSSALSQELKARRVREAEPRMLPSSDWSGPGIGKIQGNPRQGASANRPGNVGTLLVRADRKVRRPGRSCAGLFAVAAGSGCTSHDQGTAEVGSRLGANVLHATLPVGAEMIVAQAVEGRINDRFQPRL